MTAIREKQFLVAKGIPTSPTATPVRPHHPRGPRGSPFILLQKRQLANPSGGKKAASPARAWRQVLHPAPSSLAPAAGPASKQAEFKVSPASRLILRSNAIPRGTGDARESIHNRLIIPRRNKSQSSVDIPPINFPDPLRGLTARTQRFMTSKCLAVTVRGHD